MAANRGNEIERELGWISRLAIACPKTDGYLNRQVPWKVSFEAETKPANRSQANLWVTLIPTTP
jgi:hypothetical protein